MSPSFIVKFRIDQVTNCHTGTWTGGTPIIGDKQTEGPTYFTRLLDCSLSFAKVLHFTTENYNHDDNFFMDNLYFIKF